MEKWTFMTNHAHVLLCIAADPAVRLRDVSSRVGITERAAQRIVADLCDEGYVTRVRVGRRNRYELHPELPFRHRCRGSSGVGTLIDLTADRPKSLSNGHARTRLIPVAQAGTLQAHPA
jgi:predicted ArsR family transcriptional regulator